MKKKKMRKEKKLKDLSAAVPNSYCCISPLLVLVTSDQTDWSYLENMNFYFTFKM